MLRHRQGLRRVLSRTGRLRPGKRHFARLFYYGRGLGHENYHFSIFAITDTRQRIIDNN